MRVEGGALLAASLKTEEAVTQRLASAFQQTKREDFSVIVAVKETFQTSSPEYWVVFEHNTDATWKTSHLQLNKIGNTHIL